MSDLPLKIGDIVTISKGRKHRVVDKISHSSHRLISIEDLRNDGAIKYTDDQKGTKVSAADILIAWDGANAGTIGYGKEGLIGSTIARLRFKEKNKFDTAFIGDFLKSKFSYLRDTATGAAIPHINRKALERILLPEIEYDDQRRIGHLLGKVEGLITRRNQHIKQLDDLLKSVFLSMFGPKADGYEEWSQVQIKALSARHKGAMRTGPFGSNLLHSEFSSEGDVAVLGIDNAVSNSFTWGEKRFISNAKYQEVKNYTIYPGDVIVTIMGTIGRSAVIPDNIPPAINTKHLAAITLDTELANPTFISYSIHSSPYILSQFKSKTRGAIMSGLNLGIIKETKIKRPPIHLQNSFAEIHLSVEKLKSSYEKSLNELETLYRALSQKAFKGELDLSQIPLADIEEDVKSEETSISNVDLFRSLADLASTEYPMQSSEGRLGLLQQFYHGYLNEPQAKEKTLDDFWRSANFKAMDYAWEETFDGTEPRTEFDSEDYDGFKAWLFEQLQADEYRQLFNEELNSIEVTQAKS